MITVTQGDITKVNTAELDLPFDVQAIVNAANAQLRPGSGVCGAIYDAAGPAPFEEAERIRAVYFDGGDIPVGDVVATGAGHLARAEVCFILHAVGPIYRHGTDQSYPLRRAFWNSMSRANQLGCTGIAFPAISAGIYGYPLGEVAHIARITTRGWLEAMMTQRDAPHMLKDVAFVLFDDRALEAFTHALAD